MCFSTCGISKWVRWSSQIPRDRNTVRANNISSCSNIIRHYVSGKSGSRLTDTDKLGWVAFDIQSVSQSVRHGRIWQTVRPTDRQLDQETDRQLDQQTDRQLDQQTDRQTERQLDQQTDRQTVRPTDRQLDQQTDRQTVRPTDRQTDRQLDQQTDR